MWLCKRDLSKECEGKYKNCVDCVLDKIREEIVNKAESGQWSEAVKYGFLKAILIIDKYKAESEDRE